MERISLKRVCIHYCPKPYCRDLEIIIINDGSSDDTQKIIDKYQILYPDIIKSKTVENGGAGKARNYALDLAEGEYIGFVDSDDFISNTMYEKLYRAAIDTLPILWFVDIMLLQIEHCGHIKRDIWIIMVKVYMMIPIFL